MFKIRGNLLRAYVPQKTVQSRPIYSARGEDSGKTTPRKCQTKNNTIPFHLLRARGGTANFSTANLDLLDTDDFLGKPANRVLLTL